MPVITAYSGDRGIGDSNRITELLHVRALRSSIIITVLILIQGSSRSEILGNSEAERHALDDIRIIL